MIPTDVTLLGQLSIPPPGRSDTDPDGLLSRLVLSWARGLRLRPGDLIVFLRPAPTGYSCEEEDE